MRPLAIIPARGGSKRIPRKNLRMMAGKPLVVWTIEAAMEARCDVVVSTDDEDIGQLASLYGADWFRRDGDLSHDDAQLEPVVGDVIHKWIGLYRRKPRVALLLQPTSPLRSAKSIRKAVRILDSYDSVVGVVPDGRSYYRWRRDGDEWTREYVHRLPTQRLDREVYTETGALYGFRTEAFLREGNRICGECMPMELPPWHGWDIDNQWEWDVAEHWLSKRQPDAEPLPTVCEVPHCTLPGHPQEDGRRFCPSHAASPYWAGRVA